MFQKCKSHLKILGAWRVTWSKYHTKDPQVLGSTVQNLVAAATWRPGFVHRCSKCKRRLVMVCNREPVWEIISQHCALMQNAVSQPTLSVGQSCAPELPRRSQDPPTFSSYSRHQDSTVSAPAPMDCTSVQKGHHKRIVQGCTNHGSPNLYSVT